MDVPHTFEDTEANDSFYGGSAGGSWIDVIELQYTTDGPSGGIVVQGIGLWQLLTLTRFQATP